MQELGDIWRLTKGSRHARAVVVTHPLGVELRLLVDDDLQQGRCTGTMTRCSTRRRRGTGDGREGLELNDSPRVRLECRDDAKAKSERIGANAP